MDAVTAVVNDIKVVIPGLNELVVDRYYGLHAVGNIAELDAGGVRLDDMARFSDRSINDAHRRFKGDQETLAALYRGELHRSDILFVYDQRITFQLVRFTGKLVRGKILDGNPDRHLFEQIIVYCLVKNVQPSFSSGLDRLPVRIAVYQRNSIHVSLESMIPTRCVCT